MTFKVKPSRIKYGYDGSQKDILKHFNLKFHRVCQYDLDNEYCLVFLNNIDSKGWTNKLSNDGKVLYEFNSNKTIPNINRRTKKRITFLKDTIADYGGYSFIGIFELDKNYDWTLDVYPSGIQMDPRYKYIRIADTYKTGG